MRKNLRNSFFSQEVYGGAVPAGREPVLNTGVYKY
jgi:hypothetical protein